MRSGRFLGWFGDRTIQGYDAGRSYNGATGDRIGRQGLEGLDGIAAAAPLAPMLIWLILLAIVVIGSVVALTRVRRARPGAEASRSTGAGSKTVDVSATIRSYVMPKGWLRSSPEAQRASVADADHPRYAKATVERVNEAGAPTGSWDLLRGRTRLGRDFDNHVVLDDERVSLHHALISVRDGVYWIEDLGSTNGTFVGGDTRVMSAHPLIDGEVLRLGGVVLVFRGVPG